MTRSRVWTRSAPRAAAVLCLCAAVGSAVLGADPPLRVRIRVVGEAPGGAAIPCRVHLADASGRPVKPPGLPFWLDHFACAGEVELELEPGDYRLEVERGPEFTRAAATIAVGPGRPAAYELVLSRVADMAREGWWSGETHVHRDPRDVELLLRAEDLHVAPVITWWNAASAWKDNPVPSAPLVRFDGDRFYHLMGGEDERAGGALLYFGLGAPLPIAAAALEHPTSVHFLRQAKHAPGAWVDVEKPFWWDLPLWLASGLVDSIGIAHNHMHRGGVLDNEAWGKARDRGLYPGPQGNGFWTQDIYYHVLNAGLRIPPSAGSASGVLPNPVGHNRVYVHAEGELTWEKWWDGLRAGRCFVTNGPLLRVRANGELPGHVFTAKSGTTLAVELTGRVDSTDPLGKVEVIRDGEVVATVSAGALERSGKIASLELAASGWFLVRAVADRTDTFRFASTGPFYVELDRTPRVARRSAELFRDWVGERRAQIKLDGPAAEEAARELDAAEAFWSGKIAAATDARITGAVVDRASSRPLPARIYLKGRDGASYWARPAAAAGTALRYERRSFADASAREEHTTISAHPFAFDVAPGTYTLTVERGREYRPLVQELTVAAGELLSLHLPLAQWIDCAALGWWSGDVHVHRPPEELGNLLLAEDLNVALPLTHWTTVDSEPPSTSARSMQGTFAAAPVAVDPTHAYYPRNTEYEIFRTAGRQHTLGALLILGHKEVYDVPVFPLGRIAERARREGALLDLEKHNWPWSILLVAIVRPDLFELANNHHWRTAFPIFRGAETAPAWMDAGDGISTELEWTRFGFRAYYALLNCGLRLMPAAGTASGVHPVPLGQNRAYVHLPAGFSFEGWLAGLKSGRSFVTNGPMLFATFNDRDPGETFRGDGARPFALRVAGRAVTSVQLDRLEIVVNGEVVRTLAGAGAAEMRFAETLEVDDSGWVAVRAWEDAGGGRARFAHTAPVFVEVEGRPLRPKRQEADWLVTAARKELGRSGALVPPEARAEFAAAVAFYEAIAREAR